MSTVEAHLQPLRTALVKFVEILNKETQALVGKSAEDLESITFEKQVLAQDIGSLWRSLLTSLGLNQETALSELSQENTSPLKKADTQELEQLGKEANRLNQINGKMIQEQLRRTQTAMTILQRASHTQTLYGSDGFILGDGKPNRSIDRA